MAAGSVGKRRVLSGSGEDDLKAKAFPALRKGHRR